MEPKTIQAVYLVDSADAVFLLNPIAIRPTFEGDRIVWEDTSRGTLVHIKKSSLSDQSELPERIEIESDRGEHITLTKLTLDLFDKKAKSLVAGNPSFASDAELQNYYLTTNFNS